MPFFRYYIKRLTRLEQEVDKRAFRTSIILSCWLTVLFWMIKLFETATGLEFTRAGIYPLHLKGIPGILFSPFIHSDWKHLIANTGPFLFLTFSLFYFYRKKATEIYLTIWILSGLMVWLAAREAWHIGASGIIYGLASFLFFSGVIRNDARLLTIAVIVAFLYGGMIWGVLPLKPEISWEGHLWGGIAGIVLAFIFRKEGPESPIKSLHTKPDSYDRTDWNYWNRNITSDHVNVSSSEDFEFTYRYSRKDDNEN